jgi:flagellar motility protein MotE (MotC chaperone)
MSKRPPLLPLLAGMAAVAIIANGAAISAPAPQETRMGVSIKQSVKERDRAAAERNRALDLREQAARAAEERLKAEMQNGQNGPKSSAAKAEEQESPYDGLARIYQTMKPAKAARVFEQLELDVQVQVAQRMRDRATASILAAMSPDAAARLSMAMTGKTSAAAPPGARPPSQPTQRPAAQSAQKPASSSAAKPGRPPARAAAGQTAR